MIFTTCFILFRGFCKGEENRERLECNITPIEYTNPCDPSGSPIDSDFGRIQGCQVRQSKVNLNSSRIYGIYIEKGTFVPSRIDIPFFFFILFQKNLGFVKIRSFFGFE